MTDIVFMLHGMGNPEQGWEKDAVDTLKSAYDQYFPLNRKPFDERFEIVPVNYGSIFSDVVQAWQENAAVINNAAADVGAELVEKLTGWLLQAGETDDNFVWSHAADAILYRAFPDIREQVKVHVANQIAVKVNSLNASQTWSVIGYSLGTAVAHDALEALWSSSLPDGAATGFEPQHEQAQVVAMVSNVSRVLQTDTKVYTSHVKPGPIGDAGSGCLSYLNIRHRLDPFTFPKMFDPHEWPTPALADNKSYEHVEVSHIHEENIHDLSHYLKHPLVHIPLFRKLTAYDRNIRQDDESAAVDKFPAFDLDEVSDAIALKQKLEEFIPGINASWEIFGDVWDHFVAAIGETRP